MTLFPSQAEKEGTPDSSSPELTPDPAVHDGGPRCLSSKAPFVSPALTEFQPLWFYLEFSRQFCQNWLRGEQIQLLLISNRLSFQGGQFKNVPRSCFEKKVGQGAGAEQGRWVVMTGCQLAVDSHRRVSETWAKKGKKRYGFITKEGQRDEHWLWKYVCLR